jgi:hypothetical protein
MKSIDLSGKYTPLPNGVQGATMEELADFYNKYSGSTIVKKFSTRDVAIRRVESLIKAMDEMAERGQPKQPKAESNNTMAKTKKGKGKKAPAKCKKGNGGNKRKFAIADKRIYKLVKDNPRREGTEGYKSWEKIKNGMTYDDYLNAGGRNRDLRHDILAKRIELRDK